MQVCCDAYNLKFQMPEDLEDQEEAKRRDNQSSHSFDNLIAEFKAEGVVTFYLETNPFITEINWLRRLDPFGKRSDAVWCYVKANPKITNTSFG